LIIHNKALVLVADGKRYLLLRNAGNLDKPVLVFEGGGEQENPSTHEQGSDAPGRAVSGNGTARSSMEQTDFHQLEEDRFAGEIAQMLGKLAAANDFAELIVVAPPRTLAEMRRKFDRKVAGKIIAEVPKDLTKHPVEEIAAILQRNGE
jgi:protein required for attachment to host cells